MQFHFFVFRGTILEKMSLWKVKFEKAYDKLAAVISELYKEHLYLMEADRLDYFSKEMYRQIAAQKATQTMVENSLLQLTRTMQAYYGKPVILLMDEYDVPLAKASDNGYYGEMLDVMKGISYYDYREDFYHAFFAGIFAGQDMWRNQTGSMGKGAATSLCRIIRETA